MSTPQASRPRITDPDEYCQEFGVERCAVMRLLNSLQIHHSVVLKRVHELALATGLSEDDIWGLRPRWQALTTDALIEEAMHTEAE